MTTKLSDSVNPITPVAVNFWWNESGPVETYTFDGDAYPYTVTETIQRYVMHTTPIKTPVEFFAIMSKGQEEEKVTHPRTIAPPGVEVLEYLWDFGDGTTGFGPFVEHEYRLVEPIEVKLTVIDSRGLIWSASKPVNLSDHYTPEFKNARGFISSLLNPNPTSHPNDLYPDTNVYPDTDVFPEG